MSFAGTAKRFVQTAHGVAALEFALILPVVLTMALGGYALAEFIMIGRKVSLTCNALADLTSKYVNISAVDMTTILNASAQVIAPFGSGPLSIRLSGISTDKTGQIATVAWSKALRATPLLNDSKYSITAEMQSPSTFYVVAEVSYAFVPTVNFGIVGPFVASSKLFMSPRTVGSISYTGV